MNRKDNTMYNLLENLKALRPLLPKGVDTHKKFPHIVIKKGTTFSSVQK